MLASCDGEHINTPGASASCCNTYELVEMLAVLSGEPPDETGISSSASYAWASFRSR